MKFSCLQENLNKGLAITSRIARANTSLPILNNVFLEVAKGHLNLKTTNLEIGITTLVRGKSGEEGKITIPAQLLTSYISLLPNKQVDLDLEKDKLLISCENQRTKIKGVEAQDFPIIPKPEKERGCICKKQDLKQSLNQVGFTIIPNETRPEISGALMIFGLDNKEDKLFLVGTDSYRLAEKVISFQNLKDNTNSLTIGQQIIIPRPTLQELSMILDQNESEEVNIYFSENQALFSCGDTEIVSRIISGNYPDYKQIIPANFKTKAIIDNKELTRAVKGASLFSQSNINDVNLEFSLDKNEVIVSSVNTQTGENIAKIKAEVTGEKNSITFNYRYLLDGLQNIGAEQVILEVIDSNNPGLLKPIDDNSYLYVIMPIKQ